MFKLEVGDRRSSYNSVGNAVCQVVTQDAAIIRPRLTSEYCVSTWRRRSSCGTDLDIGTRTIILQNYYGLGRLLIFADAKSPIEHD